MIRLYFTIDNIDTVMQVYDQIRIQRAAAESGSFTSVSGVGPIDLIAGQSSYTAIDADGTSSNWYRSQYYSTSTSSESSWSDPVLGDAGDLFYNPLFPDEVSYSTSQKLVIDRIRKLIGDPVNIRREYGEEAVSSIHSDNKTYELDEKGWPCSVYVNNISHSTSTDPTVNGYRYLRFNEDISLTTWSGCVEYGIDIWCYTFRWADREIMEAYDTTPVIPPLTTATANSEYYMLKCAYELLYSEIWMDSTEDGAVVRDEGSSYSPEPGLLAKQALLENVKRRLDDLVKALTMTGISGVLID